MENIIGKKFGRLTVICKNGTNPKIRCSTYLCKCECGNEKTVPRPSLRNGKTKSCGCLLIENGIKSGLAMKKHGQSNTKEYKKKYKNRYKFKKKYGKTVDEILYLKELQESKCKICGKIDDLVVDHDHRTNKFRGLICNLCNSGLGMFKDSISSLAKAIEYLEKFNKTNKGAY